MNNKLLIKLLIVDDRKENIFSLKSLLEDTGAEIFSASSGADALGLMIDNDFALALVDVQMPEMDGFELAELMHGADKTKNIPIIFVTAASESSGFAFKGYERGAVDFMYKPINPAILKSKVRIFMELDAQKELLQFKMKELRHAKEAAENANRLKSAFLANISHEIRTPLNAIIGFADILSAENIASEERIEYSTIISRNGKSLVYIINDILDLSKVEAGHIEIENINYSPQQVVNEALDLMIVKVDKKNIALKMNVSKNFPQTSVADPTRLKQILTNIIGNAIKFTEKGSVTVSLSYSEEDQMLSFTVEDTGMGIANDQAEKLFKPFMQADNSITRKFGGTGLGLVLAKRLAQLMGGDVVLLKTNINEGSSFVIKIKHSDGNSL
ncbi:MAG: ATP-binding protein [Bdellovibrionota bacterium]